MTLGEKGGKLRRTRGEGHVLPTTCRRAGMRTGTTGPVWPLEAARVPVRALASLYAGCMNHGLFRAGLVLRTLRFK
jgi:hypothetical protein